MSLKRLVMLHRYYIHHTEAGTKMYPGQPPILEYLDKNENCTQADLADFLHVSPASIAVSLKRMQKSGLIDKRTDESDMRCNRIFITDTGREEKEKWRRECDRIDEKMFRGFTDEEMTQLSEYVQRLTANLAGDMKAEDMLGIIRDIKEIKKGV